MAKKEQERAATLEEEDDQHEVLLFNGARVTYNMFATPQLIFVASVYVPLLGLVA